MITVKDLPHDLIKKQMVSIFIMFYQLRLNNIKIKIGHVKLDNFEKDNILRIQHYIMYNLVDGLE